jgi:hypothetical protein
LWTELDLRRDLAAAGHRRDEQFSVDHTARLFRAQYRRIAGRELSAEDRELLAAPPLT